MLHRLIVAFFLVQLAATSGCLLANTATDQHCVTLPPTNKEQIECFIFFLLPRRQPVDCFLVFWRGERLPKKLNGNADYVAMHKVTNSRWHHHATQQHHHCHQQCSLIISFFFFWCGVKAPLQQKHHQMPQLFFFFLRQCQMQCHCIASLLAPGCHKNTATNATNWLFFWGQMSSTAVQQGHQCCWMCSITTTETLPPTLVDFFVFWHNICQHRNTTTNTTGQFFHAKFQLWRHQLPDANQHHLPDANYHHLLDDNSHSSDNDHLIFLYF